MVAISGGSTGLPVLTSARTGTRADTLTHVPVAHGALRLVRPLHRSPSIVTQHLGKTSSRRLRIQL